MEETILFIRNPSVVVRNDFDDISILFDPKSGKAYGINRIGELIWQVLKDKKTIEALISQVKENCEEVSDTVDLEIREFLDQLEKNGLIGRSI